MTSPDKNYMYFFFFMEYCQISFVIKSLNYFANRSHLFW